MFKDKRKMSIELGQQIDRWWTHMISPQIKRTKTRTNKPQPTTLKQQLMRRFLEVAEQA